MISEGLNLRRSAWRHDNGSPKFCQTSLQNLSIIVQKHKSLKPSRITSCTTNRSAKPVGGCPLWWGQCLQHECACITIPPGKVTQVPTSLNRARWLWHSDSDGVRLPGTWQKSSYRAEWLQCPDTWPPKQTHPRQRQRRETENIHYYRVWRNAPDSQLIVEHDSEVNEVCNLNHDLGNKLLFYAKLQETSSNFACQTGFSLKLSSNQTGRAIRVWQGWRVVHELQQLKCPWQTVNRKHSTVLIEKPSKSLKAIITSREYWNGFAAAVPYCACYLGK